MADTIAQLAAPMKTPALRRRVGEGLILLVLLVLPFAGAVLYGFLTQVVPSGPHLASLDLVCMGLIGLLGGVLAARSLRILVFILGWLPLLAMTVPFVMVGEAAVTPLLMELGVATICFVAGGLLRPWRSAVRSPRTLAVGALLVAAGLVAAPTVVATVQSGGRIGWVTLSYPMRPATVSLPGEFDGSFLWDGSTDSYTFYGNGRRATLRAVALDGASTTEEWAETLARDDPFEWGPPSEVRVVTASGRTWWVRTYVDPAVPDVHDETGEPNGTRPIFVAEALTTEGALGLQIAIVPDHEADLSVAEATLLEILETVTVES